MQVDSNQLKNREIDIKLSYRDLLKELKSEVLNKLDVLEKMQKLGKYRESYSNEFNQHQLENIKIDYSNQIKN